MGRRKSSGPEFWPAIDRSLYLGGAKSGSRRSGHRRYQSLSPHTRLGIERDYSVCLSWLEAKGLFDPAALPAARWPVEAIEDMAIDMLGDGYSVASVRTRIGRLKRALAIMQSDAAFDHFDALLRELERPKARFDPIVWKVTAADLQAFGIEVMDKAGEMAVAAEMPVAAFYCYGLQIALISARPWRNRTFTGIELWSNMVRDGGLWRMRAHPHENKHRRYQSGVVPAKLVSYLETYIEDHRTALCRLSGYAGNALWINRHGRPMTPGQFLDAFKWLTAEKFGERIKVNSVRKIAATTIALHDPKNVHTIQGVLGHARYQTGEQHYLLAGAVQAHADLDATIDRLSREARDRRRLSRRKQG